MDYERKWHNIKDPAIGELQKLLKIKVTYQADEYLYNLLKNITFQIDEKNILILWVQKRLKSMGYYTGYPNGIWRQNTINGIYKLQKRNFLNCDAEITPHTWYHLLRG